MAVQWVTRNIRGNGGSRLELGGGMVEIAVYYSGRGRYSGFGFDVNGFASDHLYPTEKEAQTAALEFACQSLQGALDEIQRLIPASADRAGLGATEGKGTRRSQK